MESFPDMTNKMTGLVRGTGTGIEDPGPVPGDDAGTGRPDPEVPERARRRTFTAKYKLEVVVRRAGGRSFGGPPRALPGRG